MSSPNTDPNGAAMAAFLGGAIGAFATGFVVLLNATGIFVAPTLYGPAGGVSGRTTIAVALWLLAWGALHLRWRRHNIAANQVLVAAAILTVVGIILTLPPVTFTR